MSRTVVRADPTSGAALDARAMNLVRRCQPWILQKPSPFDIERFFENDLEFLSGVGFDYQELRFDILGYTDSDQKISVVSATLADDPSSRNLFRATTAHEAAHAILHVAQFRRRKEMMRFTDSDMEPSLRMYRESQIPLYENPEWQAWRLAKGLLMQASTVIADHNIGYTIEEMSDAFSVSCKFARSRMKDLKLPVT